jgi:hypothetical protein
MIAGQDTLDSGLRGFRPVLDGHLGNDPEIRVLMKYPG